MFSAIRAAIPSLLPALHNAGGIPLESEALDAPVGEGKAKASAEGEDAPGGAAEPGEQGTMDGGEENGAEKGAKRAAEKGASGSAKRRRLNNDLNRLAAKLFEGIGGPSSGGGEGKAVGGVGFDPLRLGAKQSRKGKEKVEEGGKAEGRKKGGGEKLVTEYRVELGEEFPSLKEVHIQVKTGKGAFHFGTNLCSWQRKLHRFAKLLPRARSSPFQLRRVKARLRHQCLVYSAPLLA